MSTKEKIQEDLDVLEQELNQHEIILFNDDVNTFDHVIDSLLMFAIILQSKQNNVLTWYITKVSVL